MSEWLISRGSLSGVMITSSPGRVKVGVTPAPAAVAV